MKRSFSPQRGRGPQVENLWSRDPPDHDFSLPVSKGGKAGEALRRSWQQGTDSANSEDAHTARHRVDSWNRNPFCPEGWGFEVALVTYDGSSSPNLRFIGLKKEKRAGRPMVLGKRVYDGVGQAPP